MKSFVLFLPLPSCTQFKCTALRLTVGLRNNDMINKECGIVIEGSMANDAGVWWFCLTKSYFIIALKIEIENIRRHVKEWRNRLSGDKEILLT